MDYTFDHGLFMALNFDGGPSVDRMMLTVSGTAMWLPLYALMICLVWRMKGWRVALLFVAAAVLALGLSDAVCGIFKHNGPLGWLLPDFPPRWRPMFTPALEGLDIEPDSLMAWRMHPTVDLPTAVHVPAGALGGRYGTVSAHAATIAAVGALSVRVIRRRWYAWLVVLSTAAICYSRIYLAKHFPMDIFWGILVGLAVGLSVHALFRRAADSVSARYGE